MATEDKKNKDAEKKEATENVNAGSESGAFTPPVEPTPTPIPTPAPAAPSPGKWETVVGPFAEAIGKPIEEVAAALEELVGVPSEQAAEFLQNPEATPDEDIKNALKNNFENGLKGIPVAALSMAIKGMRKKVEDVSTGEGVVAQSLYSVLPVVPPEESFLAMLEVGGRLKVGTTEVISAIRAALANRANLYKLPRILEKRMEDFAISQGEPCGELFFELSKLANQRRYADILAALKVDRRWVSESRKNGLLDRLDDNLWIALQQYKGIVVAWVDSYNQIATGPMAMGNLARMISGGGGGRRPMGMMQMPAVDPLVAGAKGFNDKVNDIFSGVGIPAARALAWDASNIKLVLENPALPSQIGASNKDQMLKMLGVNISSEYVLIESSITQYALGIMKFSEVTVEKQEDFIEALYMLGNSIPWDLLLSTKVSVGKSRRKNLQDDDYDPDGGPIL